jgi:hypothetical protein
LRETGAGYGVGHDHTKLNNQTCLRRYLFVAIDRATRWVSVHIYGDMTDKSSVDFLCRLKLASPIKINKILTDNGALYSDVIADCIRCIVLSADHSDFRFPISERCQRVSPDMDGIFYQNTSTHPPTNCKSQF